MTFNFSLDDDIVRILNDNIISNDVKWDGAPIEIGPSDLDFIHSQCHSSSRPRPGNQISIENHIREFSSTPIRLNVIKRKKSLSSQIRNKNPKISVQLPVSDPTGSETGNAKNYNFNQNRSDINRLINPVVDFVDSGPIGGYSNVCKTLKQYNTENEENRSTNQNPSSMSNQNQSVLANQNHSPLPVPVPLPIPIPHPVPCPTPVSANQNPFRQNEEKMDQSDSSKIFGQSSKAIENMEVNSPKVIKKEVDESSDFSFLDIFPSRSAIIEKINEKRKEISENKNSSSSSSRVKSQQTIIYERQKSISQNIPPKFTPTIIIPAEELNQMRERAIDTRTMMAITKEEIEHLILNNLCQPVLNRKNDIGLEFPCRFCDWYHERYNVPIRSYSRKEEIKRHHMLHLNHDRHNCQLCTYKCVRADHLHRHMRNKHPHVHYCHKSKRIIPK